jgi:MraZ protein
MEGVTRRGHEGARRGQMPCEVGGGGVPSHEVERGGAAEGAPGDAATTAESAVATTARAAGPRFFTGTYEHSVDDKNRLVLPAAFRPRLAAGAYIGPLDGCLGLWPDDQIDAVFARWEEGVALGLVSSEAFDAFVAATFPVQPDAQGRVVVHRTLREFADLSGPVLVVGARQRLGIWARHRWERRMEAIEEGPDAALRQAARDLKL